MVWAQSKEQKEKTGNGYWIELIIYPTLWSCPGKSVFVLWDPEIHRLLLLDTVLVFARRMKVIWVELLLSVDLKQF